MTRWLRAATAIALTLFIALVLTIVPRPQWADALWPTWVALAVFYWSIALPEYFGVAIAWLAGLLMDALLGTPLGAHALALMLVAFVAARAYVKLRLASVWQQALTVGLALALYAIVLFWVGGLTGLDLRPLARFVPVVIGVALWPVIFAALRGFRRRIIES
ncbi:MAG: rod shape-determining protein MreD [Gammaproteobacteria bacterium]|nr:rod shape-determining protein MreD [Gammaproteobacteria bacterium]